MASFFKKINGKHPSKNTGSSQLTTNTDSPNTSIDQVHAHTIGHSKNQMSPSAGYESPPISSLPSPPVSQLKDDKGKFKHFAHRSPSSNNNRSPALSDREFSNQLSSFTNQAHKNVNIPQSKSSSANHGMRSASLPSAPPINSTMPVHAFTNRQFSDSVSIPQSQSNNFIVNDTSTVQIQSTPWRKRKLFNSPFPRFGHAVSSLTSTSGALYLMGGLSGNEVYGDMWVIEPIRQPQENDGKPSRDSQLIKQNSPFIASPIENFQKIPSPRTGHASILIGNAFIIFGGDTAIDDDHALDNQLYFFNITSLKWTITSPEGPKPCGRYGTQIAVLNFEVTPNKWSSQLYVFGGELNDKHFNDLWKFDLSNFRNPNNTWVKLKPKGEIPPPLTNHSMTAYNEKIYIFGGQNSLTINDKLYCYDSTLNEWHVCQLNGPTVPPALFSHSATIYGSLLFIYGGKLANDTNSDELYIIDLSNMNSWKLKSKLPFNPGPRYGHSITVNPTDEKLLVMGGDVYDRDFSGVDETPMDMIDESKFSYASSIIYECDIKEIETFIDKPQSLLTSSNPTENKVVSRRASIENFPRQSFPSSSSLDASERAKSKSNIDLPDARVYDEHFVSSTPINASLDDMQAHNTRDNTTLREKSNLHEARSITTSAGEIGTLQEGIDNSAEVGGNIIANTQAESARVVEANRTFETEKDENGNSQENFSSAGPKEGETEPDSVDDYSSIDRVASTVIRNSGVAKRIIGAEEPTSRNHRSLNENSHTSSQSALNTPNSSNIENGSSFSNTPGSASSRRGKFPTEVTETSTSLRTPVLQQTAAAIPFSPAVLERDNMKLQKLINIVNDVKMEMKTSISNANAQIIALEQEKAELERKVNESQRQEPVGARRIGSDSSMNSLAEKNAQLQKFIDEDLAIIPELKSLVKEQEIKIEKLIERIKGEEMLQNKIFQLDSENKSLKEKLANAILIGSSNLDKGDSGNEEIDKTHSRYDDLNGKLDILVEKWRNAGPQVENGATEDAEKEEMKDKIEELSGHLQQYESLFTESKNSLNKSHRALLLSQSEAGKLKQELKSVTSELEELKLKKRVYSTSSSRIPSSSKINNEHSLVHTEHEIKEDGEEENDTSLLDDHYEIRIKDLEANVYIVSQERDQLRDELMQLKKQLYNSHNSSFASPNINSMGSSPSTPS